jgi:hypothetical protein
MVTLQNGRPLSRLYERMTDNIAFSRGRDCILVNDFSLGPFGVDSMEWAEIKEHFLRLVDVE